MTATRAATPLLLLLMLLLLLLYLNTYDSACAHK
jgi:hypothetical protein